MKSVNYLAILLLGIFGVLAITSMWNDSANYDERIHLPAGYSYLTHKDMRLNPEHPPLVKDLSALPLLFLKIKFPYQSFGWNTLSTSDINRTPSWQTDVAFGNDLLYYSGNDAQKMMRYGRLLIILIGVLLGFYIWKFSRELWGESAAVIALAMYSFSPTVLAHSRLVTTDVAAAAAFFISFYYLYKWLKI
ncbi:MAG: 4-amino-4-deoxy-L-arabinose transferase, partial [Candidatus Azambacteria bacterium GW2011_GWA2_42_9]